MSTTQLHTGVANWTAQQGLGLGALSSTQKQRAAQDLGVDLESVQGAIDSLLLAQADLQSAGQGVSGGTPSNLAAGGRPLTGGAMMVRLTFSDTDAVMSTLQRTQADRPVQDLAAFRCSTYSDADVLQTKEAFNLNSISDAKAFIGQAIRNGTETLLEAVGVTPHPFDSHEMTAAFARSAYSDADVQAAVDAFDFSADADAARGYIGLKIINGTEDILSDAGISSHPFDRHEQMNAFLQSGYSDSDARAALKTFDFLSDLTQAKQYIGLKVINDYEPMLAAEGITRQEWDGHELLSAFNASPFTDADAAAAAQHFSFLDSVDAAREYIGMKVVNGTEYILSGAGIDVQQDDFRFGQYSDQDAAAAMTAFQIPTLGEAKRFIATQVKSGTESVLRDVGITPQEWDSHELMHSFARSGYSQADAQKAFDTFGFLHSVDEAKEYIGLKIQNGFEEMMADVGITPSPFDRHDQMTAFTSSGYTEADAQAAVKAFDFLPDLQTAKEYIGLKVINGYESMMADEGITQSVDAHETQACFSSSSWNDGDVLALSRALGGGMSMAETRAFIGSMLAQGNDHVLERALQQAA